MEITRTVKTREQLKVSYIAGEATLENIMKVLKIKHILPHNLAISLY